jgi:hypothetical protein
VKLIYGDGTVVPACDADRIEIDSNVVELWRDNRRNEPLQQI